jgi:Arc/MetJ family transcription regulator
MRITVDIPDEKIEAVQRLTGISKKSPAVSKALDEYLVMKARREFASLILEGGVKYSTSNDEIEDDDVRREKILKRPRR